MYDMDAFILYQLSSGQATNLAHPFSCTFIVKKTPGRIGSAGPVAGTLLKSRKAHRNLNNTMRPYLSVALRIIRGLGGDVACVSRIIDTITKESLHRFSVDRWT